MQLELETKVLLILSDFLGFFVCVFFSSNFIMNLAPLKKATPLFWCVFILKFL